jgi:DNA polymerase-3 subunit beta
MKARCPREGLLAACQLASAAVPSRDIKPILRNLKAVATEDRCTLFATDLEVGLRLDVLGLSIEEPGEAILPANRLINILREARDDELVLEADPSACTVRGASLFYEMPSEDPAQFPEWPAFSDEKHHEIPAGNLREMIRRTLFAVSQESGRFSMTGVLWELDGESMKLVATDGKRLALSTGSATAQGGHSTKGQMPVVPTKAMALLERNLQDDESELVKVSFRPNDALFRTGRAVLYTRLVEGRFPDYRLVLPKKHSAKAILEAAPFQAAVRQAAVMSDDESKKVVFSFEKDKLRLEAQGPNSGRSKVELPIKYDGKGVTINFNPQYVIDMLRVLPPEAELVLELIDGNSPALFKSGGDYQYLVMPLS